MVAKPNLIADDDLNGKIERMFNNPLFQRMVERADVIQENPKEELKDVELPLNTPKLQEDFVKKVAREAKSDKKNEEMLPHFGASDDFADLEIGETPVKEKVKNQASEPQNKSGNESFGMDVNANKSPEADNKEKEKPKKEEKKGAKEKKKKDTNNDQKVKLKNNKEDKKEKIQDKKEHNIVDKELAKLEAKLEEEDIDEYIDDEDIGFELREVEEEDFERECKRLSLKYGYPARSIKPDPTLKHKKDDEESDEESEDSRNDSAVFDPKVVKDKREKEAKRIASGKPAGEPLNKFEGLVKKVDKD